MHYPHHWIYQEIGGFFTLAFDSKCLFFCFCFLFFVFIFKFCFLRLSLIVNVCFFSFSFFLVCCYSAQFLRSSLNLHIFMYLNIYETSKNDWESNSLEFILWFKLHMYCLLMLRQHSVCVTDLITFRYLTFKHSEWPWLLDPNNFFSVSTDSHQGCQIFLGPNIPNWEKYTKWPQVIPNGHQLNQMDVKYSKWS
jgi:hypothetical protein